MYIVTPSVMFQYYIKSFQVYTPLPKKNLFGSVLFN